MTPLLWLGVLLVVALPWLGGEMRRATLDFIGLHAALALLCGIGAVLLKAMQPGRARWTLVILLLLVCFTIAMVWQYVEQSPPFSWPDAIVGSVGFVVLPVIIAGIFGNGQRGAMLSFVLVTSLAIAAAPMSTAVTMVLTVLILSE